MCLLSYYPDGVMPDLERLANGCEVNQDGFGFAIVTGRRELIVRKGMQADAMIEAFGNMRAAHPEGPALFHSRWSTSGNVNVDNCHPFYVGRDQKTVVAHNGVMFDPGKDSPWSDTALFARHILPSFSFDKPSKRQRLERYLGMGNKLVILTVNPQRRKTSYVINEDMGYWLPDGEWHSNRDYEGWTYRGGMRHYSGVYSTYGLDEWDDAWFGEDGAIIGGQRSTDAPETELRPDPGCEICLTPNAVDMVTMICRVCHSCQDCGMDARSGDCQCFYGYASTPARLAIAD